MEPASTYILETIDLQDSTCLASHSDGTLTICERLSNCIIQIDPSSPQSYELVAGTRFKKSNTAHGRIKLNLPKCFAFSPDSDDLYICDTGNHAIKKFDRATSEYSIIKSRDAVEGLENDNILPFAHLAFLDRLYQRQAHISMVWPKWISINQDGTTMAVCDGRGQRILLFSTKSDSSSNNSNPSSSESTQPCGIFADTGDSIFLTADPLSVEFFGSEHSLYISCRSGLLLLPDLGNLEYGFCRQSRDLQTKSVRVLCGNMKPKEGFRDGKGKTALFHCIVAMASNESRSTFYLSDYNNNRIRMFCNQSQMVSTIAGDGSSEISGASLWHPQGICWFNGGDLAVINSTSMNNCRITVIQDVDSAAKEKYVATEPDTRKLNLLVLRNFIYIPPS